MNIEKIENTRTIGSRVDILREIHNEKKCDLAEVIGVSPGHLSDLLKDYYNWTEDKVLAVANHYGADYNWLYYGEIKMADSYVIETEIIHMRTHLQSLSGKEKRDEGKRIILEILDAVLE